MKLWPLAGWAKCGTSEGQLDLRDYCRPVSLRHSEPEKLPTNSNGLDDSQTDYTHTRPDTQRQQIEAAIRRWPESLRYAMERVGGK